VGTRCSVTPVAQSPRASRRRPPRPTPKCREKSSKLQEGRARYHAEHRGRCTKPSVYTRDLIRRWRCPVQRNKLTRRCGSVSAGFVETRYAVTVAYRPRGTARKKVL